MKRILFISLMFLVVCGVVGCDWNEGEVGKEEVLSQEIEGLSADGNQQVYIYNAINESEKENGVYIKDLDSGEDKLFRRCDFDSNPCILRDAEWSEDDQYLVLDTGTSPTSRKIVIDSETGEELVRFMTMPDDYFWLDDEEIVFSDLQIPHLVHSGYYKGITKININTGEKIVLKEATKTKDYNLLKVEDGVIHFKLLEVVKEEDWFNESKHHISFGTIEQ